MNGILPAKRAADYRQWFICLYFHSPCRVNAAQYYGADDCLSFHKAK